MTSFHVQRNLRSSHVELADHAVVLVRADGELQVGVEPRSALIFAGPGYPALLDRLRAPATTETLVGIGQAAGLSSADVTAAVQRLRAAACWRRAAVCRAGTAYAWSGRARSGRRWPATWWRRGSPS